MLDIIDFITERGGNPEKIRESQRKRFAPVEVVDEIIALYEEHRASMFRCLDGWNVVAVTYTSQPTTVPRRLAQESTPSRSRLGPRRR